MSKVQVNDAALSMYHRGSGLVEGLVALRMLRPLAVRRS